MRLRLQGLVLAFVDRSRRCVLKGVIAARWCVISGGWRVEMTEGVYMREQVPVKRQERQSVLSCARTEESFSGCESW